jgi:hypothetical protein
VRYNETCFYNACLRRWNHMKPERDLIQ